MNNNKISDVAIIAGQGLLPKIVYEGCIKKDIKCVMIGLKDEFDESLFSNVKHKLFAPHKISSIIEYLKTIDAHNIVIVGRVRRKHLSKLILDKMGLLMLKEIIQGGFNDSNIYTVITKTIEKKGFKIIPPELIVEDILAKKGIMNSVKITERLKKDIYKGVNILKGVIRYDIGQALVINNGLILGVEAVEGTNDLLKRCAKYRENTEGGILIKLHKPHQDQRLDLPCIGPDTIKIVARHGYKGIVIEAKKSIIIDSVQSIKLANDHGIFIYGV